MENNVSSSSAGPDQNPDLDQNQNPSRTWTDHSVQFKAVSCVLLLVTCALGVAGNVMVILVVLVTRHMRTPTNCYLVSLAAADLLVLAAAGLPAVPDALLGSWVFGRGGCLLITYLQYLGINASSGSICAFTAERYIAICHPMRAQALCTAARAKRIILLLWLCTSAYCVMWFYLSDVELQVFANVTVVTCGYRVPRKFYLPVYFLDFSVFFVLPLLLSAVLYGLIARILILNPLPSDPKGQREARGERRGSCKNARHSSATATSRRQVTKMLLVVVVLFAVLWMPYRTLVVVNSFLDQPYLDSWFLLFCKLCVYLNSAINPLIYNAMSQKFRAAFRKICRCGAKSSAQPPAQSLALTCSAAKDTSAAETTGHVTTELEELLAEQKVTTSDSCGCAELNLGDC